MFILFENDQQYPINIDVHVKHKSNGMKVLTYDVSVDHEHYPKMKNETRLMYKDLYYLIKVNDDADENNIASIEAELDLDDFKSIFFHHFLTETKTLHDTLTTALDGIGWDIQNSFVRDISRTIDLEDVTPYDIINECINMYDIVYDIDNVNKILKVIDPNVIFDKGFYITKQLNLTNMKVTSDTYNFCTCLKCYGYTDEETGEILTIESVNDGKDYVVDKSYSNKEVWGVFKDERYKKPAELLEAGKRELLSRCKPYASYEIDIVNVAKLDPDTYYLLNPSLYDIVTVKDDIRKVDVVERIMEYDEYENHPELETFVLTQEPISPDLLNSNLNNKLDAIDHTVNKINGSFLSKAKEKATEIINEWAEKGYVYMTENEIYILDNLPKEKAKYCIRINLGGIAFSQSGWEGPYNSAWTIDGKFNADFITAGEIKGLKVIGCEISNGNNFIVDKLGNMKCFNADIYSGTFRGVLETDSGINVGNSINFKNDRMKQISMGSSYIREVGSNTGTDESNISIGSVRANGDYIYQNAFTNENVFGWSVSTKKNGKTSSINLDETHLTTNGNLFVNGSLTVTGEKHRVIKDFYEGNVYMNAIETPEKLFEDFGSSIINDDGICVVRLNKKYLSTIEMDDKYFTFITLTSAGSAYVKGKYKFAFVVSGTPGSTFDWNVVSKQRSD